jgi:hypothetical protein
LFGLFFRFPLAAPPAVERYLEEEGEEKSRVARLGKSSINSMKSWIDE